MKQTFITLNVLFLFSLNNLFSINLKKEPKKQKYFIFFVK